MLDVLGLVVTHWDQVVGMMEAGLFLLLHRGKTNGNHFSHIQLDSPPGEGGGGVLWVQHVFFNVIDRLRSVLHLGRRTFRRWRSSRGSFFALFQ